jgi:hypothetical protein
MAQITINTQVLSGNLGDGWNYINEAAQALADFTESTWRNDLAELEAEGHEVKIEIDVQRNTSGWSRDLAVSVVMVNMTADEVDAEYELQKRAEVLLTNESTIWDRFCSSDKAATLC